MDLRFPLTRSSYEYLLFGQDDRHSFGPFGVQGVNETIHLFMEHLAVEEQQGTEGLILRGGGDVFVDRQVSEIGFDFGVAHLGGVAFAVERDVAFDPMDVSLLPSTSSGHAVRME